MYTLIRKTPVHGWVLVEAPALALSLVVAEVFFRFHSFTLECLAFLGTWFVVSGTVSLLTGKGPDSWQR